MSWVPSTSPHLGVVPAVPLIPLWSGQGLRPGVIPESLHTEKLWTGAAQSVESDASTSFPPSRGWAPRPPLGFACCTVVWVFGISTFNCASTFFPFVFIWILAEVLIPLPFQDFPITMEIKELCQIGTGMSINCQFITLGNWLIGTLLISKSVVINHLGFNLDLQSAGILQIATVPTGKWLMRLHSSHNFCGS